MFRLNLFKLIKYIVRINNEKIVNFIIIFKNIYNLSIYKFKIYLFRILKKSYGMKFIDNLLLLKLKSKIFYLDYLMYILTNQIKNIYIYQNIFLTLDLNFILK